MTFDEAEPTLQIDLLGICLFSTARLYCEIGDVLIQRQIGICMIRISSVHIFMPSALP